MRQSTAGWALIVIATASLLYIALALVLRAEGLGGDAAAGFPRSEESAAKPVASDWDLTGTLISQEVSVSPVIDGQLDAVWGLSSPARIPLQSSGGSAQHPREVELRSVHAGEDVYFYASWTDRSSPPLASAIRNRLTVHFDIPEPWPGAQDVMCLVACHTAFSDGHGRVSYVIAETIPTARTDPQPASGFRAGDVWHLEWSRRLVHSNLFDVQFRDLERTYTFIVKVFDHVEDQPDLVSPRFALVFRE